MSSIYDNIREGAYNTKLELPSKDSFTRFNAYKNGEAVMGISNEEALRYRRLGYLIESVFDKDGYIKERDAYCADKARLHEKFKEDLYIEYSVQDNPKREKAFAIAWDEGHASGYDDVVNYFDALVDLIV